MALVLGQSTTAIRGGLEAFFYANGGTGPYTYAVVADGAGGSIGVSTGLYTAPYVAVQTAKRSQDTVEVTDTFDGSTAQATIVVGSPLLLFCEVIQRELGLQPGRVYLWDQKINQPSDDGLYVVVSVLASKPIASINRPTADGSGLNQSQFITVAETLGVDIISRSPAARDRKFDVLIALASNYSRQQQDANSFQIARLPAGGRILNLSEIDGAAIPYRFHFDVNITYAYERVTETEYYDELGDLEILVDTGSENDEPVIVPGSV